MIHSLAITLAQGLALHGACIEVSDIEVEVLTSQAAIRHYKRKGEELAEVESSEGEEQTLISSLAFKASAWVNVNTKNQGLPAFDVVNKQGEAKIKIDFDKYPAIADHFDSGFSEDSTELQRIEGTCDKFIKEILVEELKA